MVCALHPIPNQGARHCGGLFSVAFARFGGPPVELRVVTVPTSRGLEDVVLRLLAGAKPLPLPLENIGLSQPNLLALRAVVQKSCGLV